MVCGKKRKEALGNGVLQAFSDILDADEADDTDFHIEKTATSASSAS